MENENQNDACHVLPGIGGNCCCVTIQYPLRASHFFHPKINSLASPSFQSRGRVHTFAHPFFPVTDFAYFAAALMRRTSFDSRKSFGWIFVFELAPVGAVGVFELAMSIRCT